MKRRRRRRKNPSAPIEVLAVVGSGIAGAWVGYALGAMVTGSKLTAPPYSFAGTLAGATLGHFLVR